MELSIPFFPSLTKDTRLTVSDIIVYWLLTSLSITKGYSWSSNEYIELATGFSNTTIKKSLKALEDYSYIKREWKSNARKIYIIQDEKVEVVEKEIITIEEEKEEEWTLKWVPILSIIDVWNSVNDKYKLPKVSVNNMNSMVIKDLKDCLSIIKSRYSKDDYFNWLENYLKDIDSRNSNSSYSTHRFTLNQFLRQKNWLMKFSSL